MTENRTTNTEAQAIAGAVLGIILAIVGFYLVARAEPPAAELAALEVVFKAILGMLIGYTVGTLSGLYFADRWLTGEWSVVVLFFILSYLATVVVVMTQLVLEIASKESAQLAVYLVTPPTAVALVLVQIGGRAKQSKALLSRSRDTGGRKMGDLFSDWRKRIPLTDWRILQVMVVLVALLLPILGMYYEYTECVSLRATAYSDVLFGSYAFMRIAWGFCAGAIPAALLIGFLAIASRFPDE